MLRNVLSTIVQMFPCSLTHSSSFLYVFPLNWQANAPPKHRQMYKNLMLKFGWLLLLLCYLNIFYSICMIFSSEQQGVCASNLRISMMRQSRANSRKVIRENFEQGKRRGGDTMDNRLATFYLLDTVCCDTFSFFHILCSHLYYFTFSHELSPTNDQTFAMMEVSRDNE